MAIDLNDYVDVAERIREFRKAHPTGSLQQHAIDFREFAGKNWVIYTATAYRTPEDERPGMGTAWEQVPGKTPYTRDSELQNVETAAWGRAIVAVLAADTKKVASRQEVQSRSADPLPSDPEKLNDARLGIVQATLADLDTVAAHIKRLITEGSITDADADQLRTEFTARQHELEATNE